MKKTHELVLKNWEAKNRQWIHEDYWWSEAIARMFKKVT